MLLTKIRRFETEIKRFETKIKNHESKIKELESMILVLKSEKRVLMTEKQALTIMNESLRKENEEYEFRCVELEMVLEDLKHSALELKKWFQVRSQGEEPVQIDDLRSVIDDWATKTWSLINNQSSIEGGKVPRVLIVEDNHIFLEAFKWDEIEALVKSIE